MEFTLNLTGDITATVSWTDEYGNSDSETLVENKDYSLPVDLTLTASGQYSTTPTISWNDDYGNYESQDFTVNGETATIINFNPSMVDYATGEITAEATAVKYNYTFNFRSTDNYTANINMTSNSFEKGDNPELILTANEGYFFQEPPELLYQDPFANETTLLLTSDQTDEFKTVYSYTDIENVLNDDFTDESFTIDVITTVIEIPTNLFGGYGILNIYEVDADTLKQVELMNPTEYPMSDYVLELNRLFITVDDVEASTIKLGQYDTDISANLIKTDMLEINLGSVTIPEKYGNANDYTNTEIEIFLPFLGFETLEPENIINQEITLIYKVNIINGDTSILIYNSNETLIKEFDCSIGYEIPYYIAKSVTDSITGKLKPTNKHLLGFTPYILHRTFEPINSVYKKEFGVKQFNNISGFHKFTDINLNQSGLLKNEYDEIIDLLNEGVIF